MNYEEPIFYKMNLTEIEILNGIFSLSIIIVFTFLGLIIVSRYFKNKNKNYILVGIVWIGLAEPWYGSAISFLYTLITQNTLPLQLYLLASNIGIPIFVFLWIVALTDLLNLDPRKKKAIQIIFAIYGIIIEILLIYSIIFIPNSLGELSGLVDITYKGWLRYYLLSVLVILLVAAILFARDHFKSEHRDIRFRGLFILLGFVFFVVGSTLDTAIELNTITLPITRTIVIIGSIIFCIGFLMPEKLKQYFLRKS